MQQYILPYLAHNNVVSLNGIGSFVKDNNVPQWLSVQQQFDVPNTIINFYPDAEETTPAFIEYIKQKTSLQTQEIKATLNALNQKDELKIDGIGHLVKDLNNYKFILNIATFFKPINAPKVIRQNAVHQITVGNETVSNLAMQEYYEGNVPVVKKGYWFLTACILFALTCAYIIYYYLQNQ